MGNLEHRPNTLKTYYDDSGLSLSYEIMTNEIVEGKFNQIMDKSEKTDTIDEINEKIIWNDRHFWEDVEMHKALPIFQMFGSMDKKQELVVKNLIEHLI